MGAIALCPLTLAQLTPLEPIKPEPFSPNRLPCLGGSCLSPVPPRRTSPKPFQTILHFNGRLGAHPKAGLILAKDGLLYGSTAKGGKYGKGTLFRLSPEGEFTVLVHFNGPNGAYPLAELTQASDGMFYGSTAQGGQHNQGTLFRLTPTGELTTLVHFYGHLGALPSGALVEGEDRVLYGTTQKGGNLKRCPGGCGTVFRLKLSGGLLTLLEFNGVNGSLPTSGVMLDQEGKLWGTTAKGGKRTVGLIFRLDPAGGFQKIAMFNIVDGARPMGRLLQGPDQNLYVYGITQLGGDNGQGTLFKVSPSGQLIPLHHFSGPNGANPDAGMMVGRDGSFYGTAVNGTPNQPGVIYQWSAQGQFKILKTFHQQDGANPRGVLVQGEDDVFYGVTENGGQYDQGTIFRLKLS